VSNQTRAELGFDNQSAPPPARSHVPRHKWVLEEQKGRVARHRCAHCRTQRIQTTLSGSFPFVKFTLPDGQVVTGKVPACPRPIA
jgi:hypothetical protein